MKGGYTARPLFADVDGAPFKVGGRITVVLAVDGTTRLVGQSGTVEYLEYDCGCGQTYPHDPMIGVVFPDGQREEYWAEELRKGGLP